MIEEVETHPVQLKLRSQTASGKLHKLVTLKAYEVYCHLYGEQEAMITNGCRGGFGLDEIIAFLYAHTFPKSEWENRVDEAFIGMDINERI